MASAVKNLEAESIKKVKAIKAYLVLKKIKLLKKV